MSRPLRVQPLSIAFLATFVACVIGGATPIYDVKWRGLGVTTHGRVILRPSSGKARGGRVLGVLGPSGSGKSTLLQGISGTLPGGSNRVLRGEVNFQTNGDNSSLVEANSSSNSSSSSDVEATLPRKIPEVVTARSGVGVLPQETTFFSCLSARETLELACFLQQPRATVSERKALVSSVIQSLGLEECAERRMGASGGSSGGGGSSQSGLSGGERRRVAVAMELLRGNPHQQQQQQQHQQQQEQQQQQLQGGQNDDSTALSSKERGDAASSAAGALRLMVADEATSGLDSRSALHVMQLLKAVAVTHGVPVVVTLHQPRSEIWHSCLDDVLLLGPNGTVMYHGPRDKALPYFHNVLPAFDAQLQCPSMTNPAEWLIDLVSVDCGNASRRADDEARCFYLAQAWQSTSTAASSSSFSSWSLLPPLFSRVASALRIRRRPNRWQDQPHSSRATATPASMARIEEATTSSGAAPTTSTTRAEVQGVWVAGQRLQPQKSQPPRRWGHRILNRLFVRPLLSSLSSTLNPRSIALASRRVGALLKRAYRQAIRDRLVNGLRVGVALALVGVFGALFGTFGPCITAKDAADRFALISFAVINMAMMGTTKSLEGFGREASAVLRERASGQYSALEYLLAKTLVEVPSDASLAAFFGLCLHQRTQLRQEAKCMTATLAAVGACSAGLGFAVGAWAPSPESALAAGAPVTVLLMVLGIKNPGGSSSGRPPLPKFLQLLAACSPIKHGIEALATAEFAGASLGLGSSSSSSDEKSKGSGDVSSSASGTGKMEEGIRVGGPLRMLQRRLKQKLSDAGASAADTLGQAASGDDVLARVGVESLAPEGGSYSWELPMQRLGKLFVAEMAVALVGLSIAQTPRFAQPQKGREPGPTDAPESTHGEPNVALPALHNSDGGSSTIATTSERTAGGVDEEAVELGDAESELNISSLDWASAGIALATGLAAASQGM